MERLTLERRQVWIYLTAIACGLLLGVAYPDSGPALERLLWPTLMLLLFTTFSQVPLLHLRDAFTDLRFVGAVIVGNFVLVPLLVWGLLHLLPTDPPLRLGVLLVLLVPCTDWFITFSQLGRGNVPRAITITPLNLILQLLLLPLYLWLMAANDITTALTPADLVPALLIVLVPLGLAALAERWIEAKPGRSQWREMLAWGPVPLLALVVFLIAGAQVGKLADAADAALVVVPLFVLYLLLAAPLARLLAQLVHLPVDQGRTLAFSLGTRNSFVVLPFALTLPPGWEMVAVVIVLQSLVELLGMVVYLWWLPRRLFR